MSSYRPTLIITSLVILAIATIGFADYREDSKVIKISGGENHSLILTSNNWLWSFGYNGGSEIGSYYGILGTGSNIHTLKEYTPVRVHDGDMQTESGYIEDINNFDAGYIHSLALDVNGFVWAWGDNIYGQLGDNQIHWPYSSTPIHVYDGAMNTQSGFLENISAIACGRSGAHSLAVEKNDPCDPNLNGCVYAWGRNIEGQLGNGGVGTQQLTPVHTVGGEMGTALLENITAVSGGEDNSIALDANGSVWTWGLNDYGQLGNGSTGGDEDAPVQVKAGQQDPCDPNSYLCKIVAIDSGWDHLLALEKYDPCSPSDPNGDPNYGLGYVYAWGRNIHNGDYSIYGGQLGDGTEDNNNMPVKVLSGEQDPCNPNSYLKYIAAVSAGDSHSMALDMFGNVWTWGDNKYGQLGNGTNDPCFTPVKVVGPDLNHNRTHEPNEGFLENIVAVSAGYWHCIAIDSDGVVWTWGKHGVGSLGLGNAIKASDSNIPHNINVVYNLTQQTFHFGIQTAINDVNNSGDIIEAPEGTYFENIDFLTKSLTLKSTYPDNWDVV